MSICCNVWRKVDAEKKKRVTATFVFFYSSVMLVQRVLGSFPVRHTAPFSRKRSRAALLAEIPSILILLFVILER